MAVRSDLEAALCEVVAVAVRKDLEAEVTGSSCGSPEGSRSCTA